MAIPTSTRSVQVERRSDERTHRGILEVMVGLLAALFTGIASSAIVANALPTIVGDLEGSQTQYTWVVTASLLAMTVSTAIWGKLLACRGMQGIGMGGLTALTQSIIGSIVSPRDRGR